jgi:hypothetical protein
VEHRSIAADQKMAGTMRSGQAQPTGIAAAPSISTTAAPAAGSPAITSRSEQPTEEIVTSATAILTGQDRAQIAALVEKVLSEYKIARGSGAPAGIDPQPSSSPQAAQPETRQTQSTKPSASEIAAEIAARVFGGEATRVSTNAAAARQASAQQASPLLVARPVTAPAAPSPPQNSPQSIKVAPFVSESDVRLALTRQEKIFIGPKTIVTPAARDLGAAHEVFVEVEGNARP